MNKKGLFTALLALGLVLTGCGNGSNATTTAPNPNVVEKVAGNGTEWPAEVLTLINKAVAHAEDPDSIPVPFINSEYYSAEYYESDEANIEKITHVLCENSETITTAQSREYMDLFTAAYEEAGFDIDKSEFGLYRMYYARKLIKGNEYFVINYGIETISYNEETGEYFDVFGFYLGYIKAISTGGWMGDYLDEWPTQGITDAAGTDIPHPDVDYTNVNMFGGYNTLPVTDNTGKQFYLDCYVLWLLGTDQSSEAAYKDQLDALYWETEYYEDDGGAYGFNMLTQVVVEFFYLSQDGFGDGLCLFIYLNSPDYVFEQSASWPEEMSYLPAYVEEGATMSFYYTSTMSGFYVMDLLVVGGVSEDADDAYKAQLETAGWNVTLETDTKDPTFQYYYATGATGEVMFYMDVYPDVGTSLAIQAIGY